MPLHQHLRVVEARRVIIRGQLEHPLEQQLRIIEHVALDADAREQPHRLDVVAVLEQERPHELLGRCQVTVGE